MNHIQTILKAVRRVRVRMLMNRIIRYAVYFGIAGTVLGLAVLLVSVWIPFYYAVPLALFLSLLGMFIGAGYGIITRPLLEQAALAADRSGMDEHLITALEFRDSDRIFHTLQREQTVQKLGWFDIKAAFPIVFPVRECIAFALAACLCVAAALVPAAAKDVAQEQHAIRQKISEETAKIEKVLDDIEKKTEAAELSDEMRDELAKLLNEAIAEMESAGSAEELEKSKERLGKKMEIASERMDDIKFDSATQRVADELGLSERMEKRQKYSAVEERIREAMESADSSLTDEELSELAKSISEKLQKGTLTEMDITEAAEMLGMDEEALRQALENIKEAAIINGELGDGQDGNGDESGFMVGEDMEGIILSDGKSGLNLPGGTGYDTGSKTGFERDSSAMRPAEKLEIPGRVVGDDENLTGTEMEGQSYFVETEDGLAWSGRKVDYGEVVGEYAAEAESRINRSEIPNDMREIVRDYFSGLTD